jgi:hypothetical protein
LTPAAGDEIENEAEVPQNEGPDKTGDELQPGDEITDPEEVEIPEDEMQRRGRARKVVKKMRLKMSICRKIQELNYQESMISPLSVLKNTSSAKPQDKIVQESQGGNFISNMDHTIYVPIYLLNSMVCRN